MSNNEVNEKRTLLASVGDFTRNALFRNGQDGNNEALMVGGKPRESGKMAATKDSLEHVTDIQTGMGEAPTKDDKRNGAPVAVAEIKPGESETPTTTAPAQHGEGHGAEERPMTAAEKYFLTLNSLVIATQADLRRIATGISKEPDANKLLPTFHTDVANFSKKDFDTLCRKGTFTFHIQSDSSKLRPLAGRPVGHILDLPGVQTLGEEYLAARTAIQADVMQRASSVSKKALRKIKKNVQLELDFSEKKAIETIKATFEKDFRPEASLPESFSSTVEHEALALATKDYAITTALAVRDIVGWTSRGEESLKHSGITITKPGLIKSFAESKSAKQGLMEFSQRINKLGTEKGIHIHNVASVAPYIKDYARYVEAKTNYSVALKKFVDATFKRQSNGNWSAEDSQRIESIYAFHARYSSEIISLALRGASFEKPEIQTALAEAARINRERAELGRSWIISNIEGKAEEDKLEQVLLESKVNPSAQQLYNQRVQRFMRLAFPAIIIPITLAYPIAGVYGLVMFLAGLTKINPVAGINALATWRAKSGIRAVDKREAGNVVEIAQRLNLRHSRLARKRWTQLTGIATIIAVPMAIYWNHETLVNLIDSNSFGFKVADIPQFVRDVLHMPLELGDQALQAGAETLGYTPFQYRVGMDVTGHMLSNPLTTFSEGIGKIVESRPSISDVVRSVGQIGGPTAAEGAVANWEAVYSSAEKGIGDTADWAERGFNDFGERVSAVWNGTEYPPVKMVKDGVKGYMDAHGVFHPGEIPTTPIQEVPSSVAGGGVPYPGLENAPQTAPETVAGTPESAVPPPGVAEAVVAEPALAIPVEAQPSWGVSQMLSHLGFGDIDTPEEFRKWALEHGLMNANGQSVVVQTGETWFRDAAGNIVHNVNGSPEILITADGNPTSALLNRPFR